MEYGTKYQLIYHMVYGDILFYKEKNFYYNWRPIWLCIVSLYNQKTGYNISSVKLPPRYWCSNTREQLKSLYF